MKLFVSTLPRNIIDCFKGQMIIGHIMAVLLTFILVASGFDWRYFLSTRAPILRSWMFPAVPIAGLLPIVLPFTLLVLGSVTGSARTRLTGWALAQAELIGALVAATYKAFTGRAHPSHGVSTDLTHVFRFGFLRGGVFWGWPSSHTTIAFATAVTVFTLLASSIAGRSKKQAQVGERCPDPTGTANPLKASHISTIDDDLVASRWPAIHDFVFTF
jgi:hypothetical protein